MAPKGYLRLSISYTILKTFNQGCHAPVRPAIIRVKPEIGYTRRSSLIGRHRVTIYLGYLRGGGCWWQMSDVGCGCWVAGAVMGLSLHRSRTAPGTVPGTVLALAWSTKTPRICTRPSLAGARTLYSPWHPGTPGTPCTTPHAATVVYPVYGSGRRPPGLTLGCTRGHMHRACPLAPYPHPIYPADRYPATRTLCH